MIALRKRLRAADGVRVHDGFPDYGKDFRRRLGIESEQAMELFHQTVSMKSVGNLTDFVREHMLEPFDAAKATADIVAHFDDLTKAHEAVQRAQAQLTALTPLLKDCDALRRGRGRDRRARRPAGGAAVLLRRSQGRAHLPGQLSRSRYRTGPAALPSATSSKQRWTTCASRRRTCRSSSPAMAATGWPRSSASSPSASEPRSRAG